MGLSLNEMELINGGKKESAAKVLGGAALIGAGYGAIPGVIIGGWQGLLIGAAAGAACSVAITGITYALSDN